MAKFLISLMALAALTQGTLANDSTAEVSLGGLVLVETDAISLDSEDLYVSPGEVRVDYRFTNTTTKDVEVLVAFPLPEQSPTRDLEEGGDGYLRDYKTELNFSTTVDGAPVQYEVVEQAFNKGVDVTARLSGLGLPLLGSLQDHDAFQAIVAKFPAAERDALLKAGLIEDQGFPERPAYVSRWDLRTSITRKQIFPAGKTIAVQHRYTPLSGGSVGGALIADSRKEDWGLETQKQYCIEDSWYRAFDKAIAPKITEENPSPYTEVWLGYVLKSGANWKGPIKDFRLVVDKGKPDNMVSFCADGVKKISDTQFEVRKKDWEPTEDLNVLIVEWWEAG